MDDHTANNFTDYKSQIIKEHQFINPEYNILENFEDIRIIGVDKENTYRPDVNRDLYNVYFSLSNVPPREWVEIFEAERRFPRHSMWRKAWIDGSFIIVHCGLDEVKMYHFKDITEDVYVSNKKYREYLVRIVTEEHKENQKDLLEKNRINNALDGLFSDI